MSVDIKSSIHHKRAEENLVKLQQIQHIHARGRDDVAFVLNTILENLAVIARAL